MINRHSRLALGPHSGYKPVSTGGNPGRLRPRLTRRNALATRVRVQLPS